MGEDEPPESALKRFRWASKTIGLVQEVRLYHNLDFLKIMQSDFERKSRGGAELVFTLACPLQARRRRYFENSQEEKKRRVKEGHMKKSK